MRLAVVDLGTNTCRLLLAEVGDGAITRTELRRTEVVRLGEGVDRSGRLAPAAIERAMVRLREYATLIDGYAPERRLLIATSALRDAADGSLFLSRVERELSLPWRVIGGEEEAALAFGGAVACVAVPPGRVLVFDIGGGSTELAIGDVAPSIAASTSGASIGGLASAIGGARPPAPAPLSPPPAGAFPGDLKPPSSGPLAGGVVAPSAPRPDHVLSLDVGAVRLTERFFATDPPRPAEWRAAVDHTRGLLAGSIPTTARRVDAGIGVAGTITTLVANHLGLREYRKELVHGRELSLATIEAAISAFGPLTSAARAQLPGIEPGREDVILAGALIAREVCRLFDLPAVLCSEADILEGAVLALAGEPDRG